MNLTRYTPTTPDAELKGYSFLSLIQNINREQVEDIFKHFGYEEDQIDPEGWYPVKDYCDILKTIEEELDSGSITGIGMAIMETASFPPEIESIQDILGAFEAVYNHDHRNITPDEGWRAEFPQEKEALVRAINPYPLNLNYGLVWGCVRRYCPKGHGFVVEVVEELEDNGQHDKFHVAWYPE